MRLCVTCVYWTLLLVSVVSSGLLFLIVASEGTEISDKPRGISQEDNIPVENVARDTIGVGEIASSEPKIPEVHPRPTVKTEREHLYLEKESDGIAPSQENPIKDAKSEKNLDLLKESLTQQPNLSQGISETGQAVVLTLVDTAAAELQSLAEPRLTGDVRSRSSAKNATLTTTTTRSIPAATTTAINLNEESRKSEESLKNALPSVLLATIETSKNLTEEAGSKEEETRTSENEVARDQVVVVRAEQKTGEETPTRTEDVQEVRVKDEASKKEENQTTSAELDDGAARARLVGGSAEEASAVILEGLVTSGPTDHHHEDIPSFSEWAQKRLEEAEKKKTHPNASIQNPGGPGRGVGGMKVRSKNYASPDCGAKIVAVNPEARSARSVLVSTRDEYMLNTCTSRVWFVVELCEAIQAKKIELANFELFSSSPKDFSVHVSDRFPTRDWSPVGQFTGKDQRDIQSFALNPQLFGKFIKVELHSHYGSEHFCPISLFRAYGTSEFEVLETETDHQESEDDDDDEDEDDPLDAESGGDSRNLFGSARDAVLRIVKKAAEVLVKTGDPSNKNNITKIQESIEDNIMKSSLATCMTPRYTINCVNCTDVRFAGVFELLSCRAGHLDAILKIPFVNETLRARELCGFYGVDTIYSPRKNGRNLDDDESKFKSKFFLGKNLRASFLASIFSPEYVVALCNVIATKERKLVLNTSYEIVGNVSANSSTRIDGNAGNFEALEINGQARGVTSSCLPDGDGNGCKISILARETKVTRVLGSSTVRQQDSTMAKPAETATTSTESLAAQIKPTKTMSKEDMRKESSVPVLEPSKDPNEETLQAEVVTTPSPILNVPTATTKTAQELAESENTVESTSQIVTPIVSVSSSLPSRETQDSTATNEANHDDATPVKSETGDQEMKQGKPENGEQEAKLTPQEQMSLDSILSDLKDLENDANHIHNANIVAQPTASSTPQQKESVFLRLSNRIKALERNMSLSGQYLEELSKRYKKQVEEMQRSLERATAAMSEESRKGEERELRRIEEITALREEINSLTQSMEILLYDRNSWRSKLSTLCQHFALIVVEIVVLILVVSYCRRSSELEQVDASRVSMENEVTRRRSAGAMSISSSTKKSRKRRPSEIASKISGTYRDLMIDDRANQETKKEKKKRRKGKANGDSGKEIWRLNEGMPGGTTLPSRRSSSIDSPSSNHEKQLALSHTRPRPDSAPEYSGGWFEKPGNLPINEKLEEPEESPERNLNHQRCANEETSLENLSTEGCREEENKNTSGGIFRHGGILKAAKLSSPSFMKTALGSRIKRNSRDNKVSEHTAHLRSDNWEWYSINSAGRSDNSGSESPSGAGATNGHQRNPSDDSGSSSATTTPGGVKKEKKSGGGGLRKMVRKLF